MHTTLRPATNVRAIALAAVVAGAVAVIWWRPGTGAMLAAGAAAGLVSGVVQSLAIRASARELLAATDAMGVRRALVRSPWGKAYILLLWTSAFALLAVVYTRMGTGASDVLPGWVVGYATMVVLRGAITLRETFRLSRLDAPPEA